MQHKKNKPIWLNNSLARTIIQLHESGFPEDFFALPNQRLLCSCTGSDFEITSIEVQVVYFYYDSLVGHYRSVHSVDTHMGLRGILVIDSNEVPLPAQWGRMTGWGIRSPGNNYVSRNGNIKR